MKMKRLFAILLTLAITILTLTGCGGSGSASDENSVIIYSSDEDYINEYFLGRLKEQFPDYNITIEYLSTGENAAKLMAEGTGNPEGWFADYMSQDKNYPSSVIKDINGNNTANFGRYDFYDEDKVEVLYDTARWLLVVCFKQFLTNTTFLCCTVQHLFSIYIHT